MAVIAEYTCSMCGITLAECHQWGPRCRKTGKRVCAACCYKCEHHIRWSGLWKCEYVTPEDRREQALIRARARFEDESRRISQAYTKKKKEEARQRAIKAAKAKRNNKAR